MIPQGDLTSAVVASFPGPIARNPYQALLYRHLAREGVMLVETPRFCVGWLWRSRRRVTTLHFHWPEQYYRYERGTALPVLSWVRLGLFGLRLAAGRALGYRIVWTVHQILPHERESERLERVAASVLARVSHWLVAHDRETAAAVAHELGVSMDKVSVIPHGSYIGVYPAGRARDAVRAELGIPGDAFVLLSFGQVRKYKELTGLVEAFEQARLEGAVLVIAGLPLDRDQANAVAELARGREDICMLFDFVPDEKVAELFGASDAAVVARADGGTSGSLILALSFGIPVIAADTPAYRELTGHGRAGWHFVPGSRESLTAAVRLAASDPSALGSKGRSALEQARALSWPEIAARTAEVLRPQRRR